MWIIEENLLSSEFNLQRNPAIFTIMVKLRNLGLEFRIGLSIFPESTLAKLPKSLIPGQFFDKLLNRL